MISYKNWPVLQALLLAGCIIPGFSVLNAQDPDSNIRDSVSIINQSAKASVFSDAYTVQSVENNTGSVSILESRVMKSIPSGSVSKLLQGRAAGVTVISSGLPGETSKVRIRGFSSFLNNDPLYVIDGAPTQDISLLNPFDIESVFVLKDAGSASIYGSRASNGVIIITTKKGDKGFNVIYDMSIGTQLPGKGTKDDVLNTQEYANLQWLVYRNDDNNWDTHPIYGSAQNDSPSIPSWAGNTDWYDEMTDPAMIMNHNLSFSGGTDKARFFAGFNIFNQDGIIIYTHNKQYNARLNSDFALLKGRIKIGEAINVSSRNNLGVPNLTGESPVALGPYQSQSIIPVKWKGNDFPGPFHTFVEGDWGGTGISWRLGTGPNVVADLIRNKKDYFNDLRLSGSTYIDIMILQGLNFRSVIGGTRGEGEGKDYTYPTYERYFGNVTDYSLAEISSQGKEWSWTNSLTFDRQFGSHKVLAVAGYEAVDYGNGSLRLSSDTTVFTPTRMLSSFIKANYSFSDRYLFSATLRRDGCSRFSESHRYGLFPSFSAGWIMSNEQFMENLKWISQLKIRGSWGITGNQYALSPESSDYLFSKSVMAAGYDLYGTFNSAIAGYYPVRIGNPDAGWEKSNITDIGFDAGLFTDRLNFTFDWFSKKAYDLLYNPPQAGTAGAGDPPYINIASMTNSGIEMGLSYYRKWNDFSLEAGFVLTAFKNRITNIAENVTFIESGTSAMGSLVRNEEGHSLSSFYGYKVAGIFNNINDVENSPDQYDARPGLLKFENQDTLTQEFWLWQQERYVRKTFIDSRDKAYIGNPNPDFTYGIDLTLSWRNFDITGFLYGSQGNDIFNYNKWFTDFWPSYQGQKSKELLYNSWTPSRKDASVPMATNMSNFSTNTVVCSYYIEDGSYLRLKSLQVGFSLPQRLLTELKIKSLRLYLQAVNLFTITGYSGLDPEIGGSNLSFGIDYGNYPNAKQLMFGINLAL